MDDEFPQGDGFDLIQAKSLSITDHLTYIKQMDFVIFCPNVYK